MAVDVTLPRARLEALTRQALAIREQADALLTALHAELPTVTQDPREQKQQPPATFGRRSA